MIKTPVSFHPALQPESHPSFSLCRFYSASSGTHFYKAGRNCFPCPFVKLYGAAITGIPISGWLYLTVIALASYFSLGKRRNELSRLGDGSGDTRKVLEFYSISFLDKNMYMCMALVNVFYALWCMDSDTIEHYGGVELVVTVPIVLLITMRYSMDVEGEDSDGDPVEVLLHDRMLRVLCVLYFSVMFAILYAGVCMFVP